MTGTIYILRNKINGKCYVGQTILSMQRRFSQHRYHGSMPIGGAIKKYKEKNFDKFEFTGIPISLLDIFEQALIDKLNCVAPHGYNLHKGGQANRIITDATKAKISKANTGRKRSDEMKEKLRIANTGKKRTRQQCLNISHALLGLPKTEAHKQSLSKSRIESGVAKGSRNPSARRVICIDTGEIFKTMKAAAIKYNRTIGNICGVCRGYTKTTAGLHWAYYPAEETQHGR